MNIRSELPGDASVIGSVTEAAFAQAAHSSHTEHFIVSALREHDAMAVSMVAEVDGSIIGHVAISPVSIADGSDHWFGLGPVSVLPEHQRQGVGSFLIECALALCGTRGPPAVWCWASPRITGVSVLWPSLVSFLVGCRRSISRP